MKKDYRLILSNTYGHPNIGDEAILTSMIDDLSLKLDSRITLLSLFERRTRRIYPTVNTVKSGALTGLPSTFKAIREADLLIIGGGGIIQDLSSFGNLLFHLARAKMAQLVGTPYMCYAVGIGPLKTPISRKLTRNVLSKAETILVRDKASALLLRHLGISTDIVEVTADPALLLGFPASTRDVPVLRKIQIPKQAGKPVIGVSLRPAVDGYRLMSHVPVLSQTSVQIIDLIVSVSRSLVESWDAHIVFFSMHPDQDDHLGQSFIEKFGYPEAVTFVSGTLNPKHMLAAIGLSDFLIGMRLHSLIFASRSSIPSIALSYAPKVKGFMDLIGQEQFVLSSPEWEHDQILNLLEILRSNSPDIRGQIQTRVAGLQERAARNTEVVRQLLERM